MHSTYKALLVTLIPLIKSTTSKLHRRISCFNWVATQNTTLMFQNSCNRLLQLFSFR
uniref:Uncharacterized protein n=1 Tax=Anguilla anguilla TaxID=7936 RepID=A0A0E9UYH2_ANGAN